MSAIYDHKRAASFDEDLILVDRVLDGDQEAFQALYEQYHDKVFAIARGVLMDADEAADAVQEVFTLVYRNLRRFDRRSRFSTWLFRIGVNRSIQQARKLRFRSKIVPLSEAMGKAEPETAEGSQDPRIAECLGRMSPQDRALLTLFYWDELSLIEIAESLGCSVNAAKTRLFRARERFRTLYEGEPA